MNIKQKLYQAKADRDAALGQGETALEGGDMTAYETQMETVKSLNTQIKAMEDLLAEQARYTDEGEGAKGDPHLEKNKEGGEGDAIKAFADAARRGFPVEKATAGSMMQSGVDKDGGYTVPEDLVTKIIDLRDAKESLLGEVRVIPVTTESGRRTIQARSQHTGFATVAEAGKFGKTATPQFTTIEYKIEKRGGYLPVTNELLADSDNNIASVATEWLADEARATANREILESVQSKAATDLTDLDGILKAWVGLGSEFRRTSKLITNDDGLAWLGALKDGDGRYLLSPNPADTAKLQLCVGPYILPVTTYSNKTIATTDNKIPMILGDLSEGVAYWDRQQFGVRVFDQATIGDFNAAEQDLTLWRGSLRDDCTLWDDEAFVNGYIAAASTLS
jgi:HK97 family phage major capsid protein